MLRPDFAASFRGRDVFTYRLPRSGVSYSSLLEWVMAAIWANYKPTEFFEEVDGEMQSLIVAAYRTHMQIEGIMALEQAKEAQRSARAARSKVPRGK